MIYIIVPVFNRIKSTKRFLISLSQQSYKDYKVVIVDDGSTDGTDEYLKIYYPEINIVCGDGTLFWGGCINKGLEFIKDLVKDGDRVAFANNDIEFCNDSIIVLLEYLNLHKNCLCHPVTVDKNQRCLSSGSKVINWAIFLTKNPFRGLPYYTVKEMNPVQIDFAPARFLIFNAELLKSVKRIDTENFNHYGGDNDFSMQYKLIGVPTLIIPSSSIIHDISATGNNLENIRSLGSFIKSLSSIKSPNNLKVHFSIGRKYCPKFQLPFYYIAVILQVIILNIKGK
jgi:GT2 family glycosyltransferase